MTTVEEIEEIDDDDDDDDDNDNDDKSGRSVEDIKSNLRMNSTKKRRNISQTRNKLKKSKRLGQRPKRFSPNLESFKLCRRRSRRWRRCNAWRKDAFLGEKKKDRKREN